MDQVLFFSVCLCTALLVAIAFNTNSIINRLDQIIRLLKLIVDKK